jgi:hypothetical protein
MGEGLEEPRWSRSRPGSSPRRIGDARVSTKAQELDRQIRALKAERCDEIFAKTTAFDPQWDAKSLKEIRVSFPS